MQGEWIRRPQAAASAVFVHGILSSGETCWRHDNGSYWPELLKNEPELGPLGIYVFTYHTGLSSGNYGLDDIVDYLEACMQADQVLECKRLIFVCHSMGGIVVRRFLVARNIELIEKEIDLFLVASPSLGSSYANWLSLIAGVLGHAQAKALRIVEHNEWLKTLDKDFIRFKDRPKANVRGYELLEQRFIELKKIPIWLIWRALIVNYSSGARYFRSIKVPQSDHFSIAKPADKTAIQHRLLCQFILENAPPVETAPDVEPLLTGTRRFDVALSFPGEHRPFVKEVAEHLAAVFGKERVLYDKYHKPELTRVNLDIYLTKLYRTQSELIVVFFSPEYATKHWCGLEWRHIRVLIGTADESRIMPLHYGEVGDLSELGILPSDGIMDFEGQTAKEIAESIHERVRINCGDTLPKSYASPLPSGTACADVSRIIDYAPAQEIWQKKLSYLQVEEATASDLEVKFKLRHDIAEARRKLQGLGTVTTNFATGQSAPVPVDISRVFKYAPTELLGREDETKLLNDAWAKAQNNETKRPHVLTFVALGGEGKTSLVAKWAATSRIKIGRGAMPCLRGHSSARARGKRPRRRPICF